MGLNLVCLANLEVFFFLHTLWFVCRSTRCVYCVNAFYINTHGTFKSQYNNSWCPSFKIKKSMKNWVDKLEKNFQRLVQSSTCQMYQNWPLSLCRGRILQDCRSLCGFNMDRKRYCACPYLLLGFFKRATPPVTQDIPLFLSPQRIRDTHTCWWAFSSGAAITCLKGLGL